MHSALAGDGKIRSSVSVESLLPHRSGLLAFLRKRVSDPDLAEDILQSALMRALTKAPEVEAEEEFLAWFYAVLRNAVIDHYRRSAADTRRMDRIAETLSERPSPEELGELCACLVPLLSSLRPDSRVLIESLELGQDSPDSVAARLGIERAHLKVRRHRARQELRKRLLETCRTCARHGCLDCTCGPVEHPGINRSAEKPETGSE